MIWEECKYWGRAVLALPALLRVVVKLEGRRLLWNRAPMELDEFARDSLFRRDLLELVKVMAYITGAPFEFCLKHIEGCEAQAERVEKDG